MTPDVERALALLNLLDGDLEAAGDRYFTSALVRGRLRPIRAALHGTDDLGTPSILDLLEET